jgi:hypothetical protein
LFSSGSIFFAHKKEGQGGIVADFARSQHPTRIVEKIRMPLPGSDKGIL